MTRRSGAERLLRAGMALGVAGPVRLLARLLGPLASLLIVVGVGLETVKQIDAQMQQRHYEGLLR